MTCDEEFDAGNAEGEAADDDLTEADGDDDLDTDDDSPVQNDDDEPAGRVGDADNPDDAA